MKDIVSYETAVRLKVAGFPQPTPEFGQIPYYRGKIRGALPYYRGKSTVLSGEKYRTIGGNIPYYRGKYTVLSGEGKNALMRFPFESNNINGFQNLHNELKTNILQRCVSPDSTVYFPR